LIADVLDIWLHVIIGPTARTPWFQCVSGVVTMTSRYSRIRNVTRSSAVADTARITTTSVIG